MYDKQSFSHRLTFRIVLMTLTERPSVDLLCYKAKYLGVL